LIDAESIHDGVDIPDKDTRIPEEIVFLDVFVCRF
jgi:hypothetical protein